MERKKILIVDNNKHILFAFRLFLESEGYTICETHSLKEALILLTRSDYFAAFVDLSAPQSIQQPLINQLEDVAQKLSLIIITSHPTQRHFTLVDHIGAFDLLEKPLSILKLRQILNKISH